MPVEPIAYPRPGMPPELIAQHSTAAHSGQPKGPLDSRLIQIAAIRPMSNDARNRTVPEYYRKRDVLMVDIKENGLKNPIRVRELGTGAFGLIAGGTRLEIGKMLGWAEIAAFVHVGEMSPTDELVEQLQENELQNPFSDFERLTLYLKIMQLNGWTQAELCRNVRGIKESKLSKGFGALKRLVPQVLDQVQKGVIGLRAGHVISRVRSVHAN